MTRLPTKALAIASNYGMTSVSQGGSSGRVPVNINAPTASNGNNIALLSLPELPGGAGSFDLHSVTISCQEPPLEDMVFDLFQEGDPAVDLSEQVQLVLVAGSKITEVSGDPLQAGLDRTKAYSLRCTSGDTIHAQGVTVTYTIGGF